MHRLLGPTILGGETKREENVQQSREALGSFLCYLVLLSGVQSRVDSSLSKAQRCLIATLLVIVILAIFPLTPKPAVDVKVLGYKLCASVALIFSFFVFGRFRETIRQCSGLLPLFIAFLGLNLAAAFASANVGYSLFREFVKLLALTAIFVTAADSYRTPKQVWVLFSAICIAVSIASLYGILQFMGMDPFPWNDTGGMLRAAPATFGNPNVASHVLAPAIILACGLCTQRKGRWAFLCIPLFACHFAL